MCVKYNCDIIMSLNSIIMLVTVFSDIMMFHMYLNDIVMSCEHTHTCTQPDILHHIHAHAHSQTYSHTHNILLPKRIDTDTDTDDMRQDVHTYIYIYIYMYICIYTYTC